MQVQPYLFFDGRCDEAVEFYRKALGAEVTMLIRFKDSPDRSMITPGTEDKVMHTSFRIGDTTVLASDGRCLGQPRRSPGDQAPAPRPGRRPARGRRRYERGMGRIG